MEHKEININEVEFNEGLIPAVIQDYQNKAVLMVAYMNPESLQLSLKTGETHFWSRSRKKLWRKGETSGHVQVIKKILIDCDQDTLLIEVDQVKAACHTGKRSCFFRTLGQEGRLFDNAESAQGEVMPQTSVLENLSETIRERKRSPSSSSYTSLLLEGGIDRILKKVGEESGEFIIGAKNGDKKEIIHETADLIYHLLVALAHYDIPFEAIEAELRQRTARSGLEEKKSRGKSRG